MQFTIRQRKQLLLCSMLVGGMIPWTTAVAGTCSQAGSTVTCTGAANSASDTQQTFLGLPDGAVVDVNGGIDTSASAAHTAALALDAQGALTVTIADVGELIGSNYGLAIRGTGDVAVTNGGLITSANNDGIYALVNDGSVQITNNGTVAGATTGINVQAYGDGAVTVQTGAGSSTTAGPAQTVAAVSTNPWGEPDMIDPGDNEIFASAGILVTKWSDSGDVTITTGADSEVSGINGIVAGNHGTGNTYVTVGDGAIVSGMGPDQDYSIAAIGGAGISVQNDFEAGEILIKTGTGSIINATAAASDMAPFGIAAQSIARAPITIITGTDSYVAASAFGILAQVGAGDTNITTGNGSTVDAAISGIVSVGNTDLTINVGDDGLVQGKWTGITSAGFGDVTVTTGTGSQVIGSGGFDPADMPPGFTDLGELPAIPYGVPLELTTLPASGIKIMAGGKLEPFNPDKLELPTRYSPLTVTVTTGKDSLVQGEGTLANGIDIITVGADTATIRVATGENSQVFGGDGIMFGPGGMGAGISVMGFGILGADVAIDTGKNSLIEGGGAGILAIMGSDFQPSSMRITTGAGSIVRGSGDPLVIDLPRGGNPGDVNHTVTPVVGISANGFGTVDSDIHVVTGADSTVTAPTFGIQAMSGVLTTDITIETGANSTVSATGSGTESYAVIDGKILSMQPMYEVMGLYTPASGILVSSTQFNEMNVIKRNVDGDFEFYSRTEQAGDIVIKTGTNSTVSGTDNGITVGTMMASQREAFFPTGQDELDPATIIWAPGRVDENGMAYGTDGDNDPTNDPVLQHFSVPVASDQIGGKIFIDVNGTVTGKEQHGIYNTNIANAAELNITVGKTGIVEGALDGIYAVTDRTLLTISDPQNFIAVFDPETGMPRPAIDDDFASSIANISNLGTIRNLSKKSTDLAIHTDNTATTINNEGLVLGTVDLDSKPGNHFNNKAGGVWNTAGGVNYLGAVDAGGLPLAPNTISTFSGSTIIGAANAAASETTVFNGVKTFAHGGTLTMQDGAANDRTVITGPGSTFVSNGGVLALDTVLAADGAPSDLLVIEGATSLGSAPVGIAVRNAGGPGAATVADGIKVVQVDGSSAAKAFTLMGHYQLNGEQVVAAGPYAYALWHNGVGPNAQDGDWYLRTRLHDNDGADPEEPLYQAGATVAEAYAQSLLAMMDMPTLQQRVGNRFWSGAGAQASGDTSPAPPRTDYGGIWARVEGARTKIDPARSTTRTRHDLDRLLFQAGADTQLTGSERGVLIGGITVHYAQGDANSRSLNGTGRADVDGYGVGATITWYGSNGFYLDAQAQATWFSSTLKSDQMGTVVKDNDGFGYAFSLEGGKRMQLGSSLSLTPQAQLVYAAIDFDNFTQMYGDIEIAHVRMNQAHSLRGRLGLSLDHEAVSSSGSRTHLYGIANLYHQFEGQSRVALNDVMLRNRADRFWGGLGLGASHNWNDDRLSIYGELDASSSFKDFGDSYALKGTLGFRYRW